MTMAPAARPGTRRRLSFEEGLALWDLNPLELARLADDERVRRFPRGTATFIKDRVINYTNVCVTDCGFCAFYRPVKHPESYLLSQDEIFTQLEELMRLGGTQVLLQGGHHPGLKIDYYEDLFGSITERFPLYIHSLSASEIDHISKVSKISLEETVRRLRASGLRSLPGGGAEILDDEIRDRISPKKISTERYFEIHESVHRTGMESTSTMVFGFGETPAHRMRHLDRVRDLQDRTGGFRAFIPWSFTPYRTALADTPAAGGVDYLKTIAVARLYLDNVNHVGCGWLTEGQRICQIALSCGADDMGGIIMDEKVIRATGVQYYIGVNRVLGLVRNAGRIPAQRDTEYNILHEYGADEWEGTPE